MRFLRRLGGVLLITSLILTACARSSPPSATSTPIPPSPTPVLPTPTSEPLAATVDGAPIRLVEYQQELARFEAAQATLGIDLATLGDYRTRVLQAMVDRRLLAAAAVADGGTPDAAALEATIARLTTERGGTDGLEAWLSENEDTLDGFQAVLAEEMLDQLQAGADFASLAEKISLDLSTRLAGGDLSWFPRGYLTMEPVETAAFSLQPGEVSGIVESDLGFHIGQTLEREDRPLTSDAWQRLGKRAVEDWLMSRRASANIETFVAP